MKPLLAVGLLAGALLALVPVAQAQQVPNDAMLTATAPTNPLPDQASTDGAMVMIEENRCTVGTLTGIGSEVYESQPGKPASKTYKAAFTAPPGAWQKATCTFTGFGHFLLLDSRAGPFDRS